MKEGRPCAFDGDPVGGATGCAFGGEGAAARLLNGVSEIVGASFGGDGAKDSFDVGENVKVKSPLLGASAADTCRSWALLAFGGAEAVPREG